MLETPHVVVGAAIATKVVNPLLAIPLALGSHFILDRVPHWNPHLNTELKKYGKITTKTRWFIVFDVVFSLTLGGFIAYQFLPDVNRASMVLLAGFAGVLPDVIEGPYFFLKWKNKLIEKWIKFQKSIQVDTTPFPGLGIQFVTLVAALWWIFS